MFFTAERIALLVCLVGGYLFGLIQSGYYISKVRNVDIKHLGSGNTGATNTWRVMGARWGLLTLLCDVAKTVIAIVIANLVLTHALHFDIPYATIVLYTGFGVVLGHDFPFYLKFKGGKGIACSFAIFACFFEWQYIIVGVLVFFIVLLISRYVSLSSLLTMIFEFAVFLLCMLLNITYVNKGYQTETTIIIILLTALAFYTHRSNIMRLFFGEESKFSVHKVRFEEMELSEADFEDEEDEIEIEEPEEIEESEEIEELEEIEEIEEPEEIEEIEEPEEIEEIEELEEPEEIIPEVVVKPDNKPKVTKVIIANWKIDE